MNSNHIYDTLVIDANELVLNEEIIKEIGQALDIDYLSFATQEQLIKEPTKHSIHGILYGIKYKPMIPIIISSKKHNQYINVICLIDINCHSIYLSEKTMIALGFTEGDTPNNTDIWFRNRAFEACKNPNSEVNIIGYEFLKYNRSVLTYDYKNLDVNLLIS